MEKCPKCDSECQPGDTECPQCGTDVVLFKEKLAEQQAAKAEQEAKAAKKKARRELIIKRLSELVREMDDNQLVSLLEKANEIYDKKDRTHPRIECLIPADYVAQSRAYRDYIKDVSMGGVFIETSQHFSEGQDIVLTLSLSHHIKPFKISGTIVRSSPNGIGVEFQKASQVQEELISGFVQKVEEFKK